MRIVFLIFLTLFLFAASNEVTFSQDTKLYLRLSSANKFPGKNGIVLQLSSFSAGDRSDEKNRSVNWGIIFRLFENKHLELEIEKYRFYENEFRIINSIPGFYETNKTSAHFVPISLSFMHRFFEARSFSLLYNAGFSIYPVEFKNTIFSSTETNSTEIQTYYKRDRKLTGGFGFTLGASIRFTDSFSVIASAGPRFVKEIDLKQKMGTLRTDFSGFFAKAGLLFDIY